MSMLLFILTFVCRRVNSLPSTPPYQALQQHNIDAYICPSYIYGTYVMLEVLLMYYYVLFSVYISGNYLIADI